MRFLKSAISPLAAMIAAGVLAAGPSSAQGTWPAPGKNITLVLPFAAGSGTDTTTRIISKDLAKALGANIVIENKPGANGSIAEGRSLLLHRDRLITLDDPQGLEVSSGGGGYLRAPATLGPLRGSGPLPVSIRLAGEPGARLIVELPLAVSTRV